MQERSKAQTVQRKERLLGAVIIAALAVILVPSLFDKSSRGQVHVDQSIPIQPSLSQSEELLPGTHLAALSAQVSSALEADQSSTQENTMPVNDDSMDMMLAAPATAEDVTVAPAVPENSQSTTVVPMPTVSPMPASSAEGQSSSSVTQMPVSTTPVPATTVAPTSKREAAPKSLQASSIRSVPSKTSHVASSKKSPLLAYTIQVGNFENQSNAKKMVDSLKKAGFAAYVVENTSNGKSLKRVMVGPSANRADAEQMVQKLQNRFQVKGFIVQYDPARN